MKFSAKTEYACLAVLELARSYESDEPLRIRSIAEVHGIPSRFLVQILLQLKGAGLVNSTRGAAGGYQLAKPPDEISLGEVMAVIEGQEKLPNPATAKSPTRRTLLRTWREVAVASRDILSDISFADLARRAGGEVEAMYHI
jgi:Rrf2 family protein